MSSLEKRMKARETLEYQIGEAIEREGVFDVHEHLTSQAQRAGRDPDLFDWIAESYLSADLAAAGMSRSILTERNIDPSEKWNELQRFLPAVRHTGYMQICRSAWRDLLGMEDEDLGDDNWESVSTAIRANSRNSAFTDEILLDRCAMRSVLVDVQVGGTSVHFYSPQSQSDWYRYLLTVRPHLSDDTIDSHTVQRDTDRDYLHRVVKVDSLLWGWLKESKAENIRLLGADTSSARTLDDYADLVDTAVGQLARDGAVGLKSAVAALRSLEFPPADRRSAEAALTQPMASLNPEHLVDFESFVFRQIVEAAGRHRLPLQIHTGANFGAGGRGPCREGAADHLTDLIQEYPETTFVLMHASWPYWGEVEQLAKRLPNVVLDLSWAMMLSPVEAARMLESLLTSVPVTKLLWGGDCHCVEETYGTFIQAKRVVARALDKLVNSGLLNREDAIDLAVRIFCTNGPAIYSLPQTTR